MRRAERGELQGIFRARKQGRCVLCQVSDGVDGEGEFMFLLCLEVA